MTLLPPGLLPKQHRGMKLSIILSDEDVVVLDDYVERAGLASRSAGVQAAVQMLRHPRLEELVRFRRPCTGCEKFANS